MGATETEFLERLAAYDGSESAAQPLGRWVALNRPQLQAETSGAVVTHAETIERTYYKVGDGDEPVNALVANLTAAKSDLATE